MKHLTKTALTLASLIALVSTASAETIAIVNANILVAGPTDSPRSIENGGIIIEDGTITAVGSTVVAPAGATVIDADGNPVTPGLFAPISGLGLIEISLNKEGNDRSTRGDFPMSAALDATDAFNPDSSVIPITRSAGVTRAYTSPTAGGNLFGGCGAVIDLSGDLSPITAACVAQTVAMGYGGAARAGDNKAAAIALLRVYLEEARLYADDPSEYRYMAAASDLTQADLAALAPFAKGEKPLLVSVHSASDILRLIELKEFLGLDLVLTGVSEGWRVARELAEAKIPVIINPIANLPGSFESMGSTLSNAARLEESGVVVSFFDDDVHNARLLPQLAGNAVANGMSYDGALAALTVNPAKMWGVEDNLGTIQAGKVGDIVVWSGDPLELSTEAKTVIINGEIMSLDNRQRKLEDRYKDLSRGDKPHAYRGN